MKQIEMSRNWAMPNSETFMIKPIHEIIEKYIKNNDIVIDPFARNSKIGTVTNDIDPETTAQYHMDALDFLKSLQDMSADVILYDPPYSPRQVSECYKKLGKTVNMQTTQASYWSNQKKEISRIIKPGGIVITCAWNSGGIGEKYGMQIIEIRLVAHGGWHNDTIITVEKCCAF